MTSRKLEERAAQRYKELMELIEAMPEPQRTTLYGIIDGQGQVDHLTKVPPELQQDYRRAWLIGKFAMTITMEFQTIEPGFLAEVLEELNKG